MKRKNNILNILANALILLFICCMLLKPQVCKEGVIRGILLCGRVIIPSIFPFTMCVLFILKSGVLRKFCFLNPVTQRAFGLSFECFVIFLLSLIGGFPIGAKLLNESVSIKKTDQKTAQIMLCYCVNAGPAFVIFAIGTFLGSVKLGYVLFFSGTAASLIIAFALRRLLKNEGQVQPTVLMVNAADNFVQSTAQAAEAVMNICGFVILFSGINSYINLLSTQFTTMKYISLLLEITNAVTLTENVYIIAFLLGFGGVSVWCQIFSVSKDIQINYIKFIFFRVLHGILCFILTRIIIKAFNITLPTISNYKTFIGQTFYTSGAVAGAMLVMCLSFVVAITTKKYAGKLIDDVV